MSTQHAPPASPAPVKEGDVLASKYRVERVLGVGGMGVVVAAHHLELDQKVALKFLLPQAAANEDLVGRFLREARASVRLKGAHVAKTLDVGRLADGCPYIVMEFLDGHDLTTEIRSKTDELLPITTACSYILQAAEGLAEAHSLGIVHRDLKPGNLFLTRGVDGRPLVKVLDFGISKTIDTSIGGDGLSLTKTEMLLGSPLYMAPEQMRSSKHVDERSDLWALGAIAYELLTTRVPFEAETILELCFKVAQENAPSPRMFRPELPEELCQAVLRCLAKDPAERFGNVGELAAAFEPFALARDRGTAERALEVLGTGKRPIQRSAAAIAASTALAAAPASSPAMALDTGAAVSADSRTAAPPAPAVAQVAARETEPVAPAAWGTTQAQPAKGRRGVVAIAAGVAVVAALAGVMVSRKGSGEAVVAVATGVVPTAEAQAKAADADAKAKAEADAMARAKAPTDAKAKAEAEAKAEADAKANVDVTANANPKANADVKATANANAKTAAGAGADGGVSAASTAKGPRAAGAATTTTAATTATTTAKGPTAGPKAPGVTTGATGTADQGGFIKVRE